MAGKPNSGEQDSRTHRTSPETPEASRELQLTPFSTSKPSNLIALRWLNLPSVTLTTHRLWRHSQVARQGPAKPQLPGSNPGAASNLSTNHFPPSLCRLKPSGITPRSSATSTIRYSRDPPPSPFWKASIPQAATVCHNARKRRLSRYLTENRVLTPENPKPHLRTALVASQGYFNWTQELARGYLGGYGQKTRSRGEENRQPGKRLALTPSRGQVSYSSMQLCPSIPSCISPPAELRSNREPNRTRPVVDGSTH